METGWFLYRFVTVDCDASSRSGKEIMVGLTLFRPQRHSLESPMKDTRLASAPPVQKCLATMIW